MLKHKINQSGTLCVEHESSPVILAYRNKAGVEDDVLDQAFGDKIHWMSAAEVQNFDPDHAETLREKLLTEKKTLVIHYHNSHFDDWRAFEYPAKIAKYIRGSAQPCFIDGGQYHRTRYQDTGHPIKRTPRFFIGLGQPIAINPEHTLESSKHLILSSCNDNQLSHALTDKSLLELIIESSKLFGRKRVIMDDVRKSPIDYQTLFKGVFALGSAISRETEKNTAVGVMLPTSSAAVITFLALQAYNRVPSMLNFSAGSHALISAIETGELKQVITSKAFIQKAELGDLIETLGQHAKFYYLEDIRKNLSLGDKIRGAIGMTMPSLLAPKASDPTNEKRAAILFTSGSEGTPKGVVLSHKNFYANVLQTTISVHVMPKDIAFNALPVFHSFGLTVGVFTPLLQGIKSFFYPSPLHYKSIIDHVAEQKPTIFFSTDTFLKGYARLAKNNEFKGIRLLVSGAEKVRDDTRQYWLDKFDIDILEGYGCTECSPVVAANTHMTTKPNSVGRLFSGMTSELSPVEGIDEGGKLVVKGPNVMMGYLRAENIGHLEPPADGWHDTGDIVTIDDEGYIFIQGRAKRFAKLGGEIVSLTMVEDLAQSTWPNISHAAVTLPDSKKGEMIVLVTEHGEADRKALAANAKASGVTELAVPKKVHFLDEIPALSSGKTDYVRLQKIIDAELGE